MLCRGVWNRVIELGWVGAKLLSSPGLEHGVPLAALFTLSFLHSLSNGRGYYSTTGQITWGLLILLIPDALSLL